MPCKLMRFCLKLFNFILGIIYFNNFFFLSMICSRLSVLKKRTIPVFDQKKNNDSILYKNTALEKAIKTDQVEKYRVNVFNQTVLFY